MVEVGKGEERSTNWSRQVWLVVLVVEGFVDTLHGEVVVASDTLRTQVK